MTNEEHLFAILKRTFETLQAVYDSQKDCKNHNVPTPMSRIIFPNKRDLSQRVCEQELRFVFVEQFNKEINPEWDMYYSVETPTENTYSGFKEGNPKCDKNGRSAVIDLVIHDKTFKRIALIEFKAHDAKTEDYEKDFLKLKNEISECKFFVNILENVDSDTFKNIYNKIEKYLDCGIKFVFWSLGERSDVTKDIIDYKHK